MLLARMRLRHLSAILPGFFCAVCSAQVGARYTVTGIVLNSATDEPVRRALVAVGPTLVFTGADGRFRAENVPVGQQQIAAQKPGYFECATQACGPNGSPARVIVNVQPGMSEVSLKLIPESGIEGQIVDGDGEPISGIPVQVLSERIFEGEKRLNIDRRATTDENGTYRVEDLMAGSYMVKTVSHPMFRLNSAVETATQVYPSRFYPNAPDASSALTLDLRPAQVARADFTVEPVRSFRISGSLTPSVPSVSISVEDNEGVWIQPQIRFNPRDGAFSISLLPAGSWTVEFAYNDQPGQSLIARDTVTVGPNDIKDLHVLLQPYVSLPVNISNEATQIQLVSTDGRWRGGMVGRRGQPTMDAGHVIEDIPPGRFRALVVDSGNQCLDSLTSGNVDLTREDLVVAPGSQPQPINVSLRDDCASIQVGLHAANQNARATVLLISASRVLRPMTVELDSTGTYSFSTLTPGDYQLYAFSSIEGLEYANPDVMRDFSGQQITLAPNQHANVSLNVIIR